MLDTIAIDGFALTPQLVARVARDHAPVQLSDSARRKMDAARQLVEETIQSGQRVYGLTSSVGAKTGVPLAPGKVVEFNRRLLLTHNFGHGPTASHDTVRAMMVVLLNAMASGYLGVRPILADRLIVALNEDRCFRIHVWGSMGESDMSPISDLALDLYADLDLVAGEALALLNSSALSLGLAALAILDLSKLLNFSTLVSALSMEGFAANPSIVSPAAIASRPFAGLRSHGEKLRGFLQGSYILDADGPRNLQDPLCFRSLPLIQGAAADSIGFSMRQIETELGASQNNPVVSIEHNAIVSVANFDMVSLSMALDVARLAMAPVVTSSAERVAKLADSFWSGLSVGLIEEDGVGLPGFNGLAQFHKSIVAEARLLSAPVVSELTSSSHSNGNLDRMSMSSLAARRANELVTLCKSIFGMELLVAAQAVDMRKRLPLGATTERLHSFVRRIVPYAGRGDRVPHVAALLSAIESESDELAAIMAATPSSV